MQKTITTDMAFGFDGEHANGQPFRADGYIATSEVTFGQPAFADTAVDGFPAAKSATSGTYIGMFVGPHQHVKMELPSDTHSITVPAGTAVQVASRGCWYTSWSEALLGIAVGSKLAVANGKYKIAASETVVAEVVALDDTKKRAMIRLV